MITVLVKQPGKAPKVQIIGTDLKSMQAIVGGYIEVVEWGKYALVCNEEGRLEGLPYNLDWNGVYIVGTVFVVRNGNDDEGSFASLEPDDIPIVKRMLGHNPDSKLNPCGCDAKPNPVSTGNMVAIGAIGLGIAGLIYYVTRKPEAEAANAEETTPKPDSHHKETATATRKPAAVEPVAEKPAEKPVWKGDEQPVEPSDERLIEAVYLPGAPQPIKGETFAAYKGRSPTPQSASTFVEYAAPVGVFELTKWANDNAVKLFTNATLPTWLIVIDAGNGMIVDYSSFNFGSDADKAAADKLKAAADQAKAAADMTKAADAGASIYIVYSKTASTLDLIPFDKSGVKCASAASTFSSGVACEGESIDAYMKRVPAGTQIAKSDLLYKGPDLLVQSYIALTNPPSKANLAADLGLPKLILQVDQSGTIVGFVKPA